MDTQKTRQSESGNDDPFPRYRFPVRVRDTRRYSAIILKKIQSVKFFCLTGIFLSCIMERSKREVAFWEIRERERRR